MRFRTEKNNVRAAAFAGRFYEGDKQKLIRQLETLFNGETRVESETLSEEIRALIVPHAGYVFSGSVAAAGYSRLPAKNNYKRIFILASSHRFSFNGVAVFTSGNYSTPLGEISVDTQLAHVLTEKSDLFFEYNDAHETEHSIEVQLPFLQHRLGSDFVLVPLLLGTHNAETCRKIATVLQPFFTSENLWIVSTDFSHYPKYDDAVFTDEITANAICSNQPQRLLSVLNDEKTEKPDNLATQLCGWTSVLTLLYMTEKEDVEFEKIRYQNSGDALLYGDKNRVVGYWSVAVKSKEKEFKISETEKAELIERARHSISHFVTTGNRGQLLAPEPNGILSEKTGVFVSIYIDGNLRGCIGGFAGEQTLNEMVQRLAASSACDRRFNPVQIDELDKMKLEISVLSPLKKIKSVNEIKLGKHGVYIKQGFSSGTFLPQVVTKTGWNLEEFLGHCARDKAGIGWNGWKNAEIFVYEAVVFSEAEI
ncbi:MAG TPA: TIGR00296 family protein [Prolixibacteraceae bacterium]|nr:TIGR00296 family protein [Prolixibacteraceae bacterium]